MQKTEHAMDTHPAASAEALNWKESLFWLAVAVVCFHGAYTSVRHPLAGLAIFGYAFGLVQLTRQRSVRRAFYFGLVTAFLGFGPQLWFFFKIFSVAAAVLWLILAFWVGLFSAIVCACIQRWGYSKAAWLIPVVWTGCEYFRSELYYLQFSWLNIGYALPGPIFSRLSAWLSLGVYGVGFFIFLAATLLSLRGRSKFPPVHWLLLLPVAAISLAPANPASPTAPRPSISLAGVQMEFPPENVIPKMLDKALARNTNADIFVLSEYTLRETVPEPLKKWCREHSKFLVVGGEDPVGSNAYYNTVFVVGTNGGIVFKQAKCRPIQFFEDGLPAPSQSLWDSPWGRIGLCVCYDLSYTRVTDELVRQGAQMLIVPTMDVELWSRHEHELHTRVAPVRAAEYRIPIFRLASSGISQAVDGRGQVIAHASMPGNGEIFAATLRMPARGTLPLDRYLAPMCTGGTGFILAALLFLTWRESRTRAPGNQWER